HDTVALERCTLSLHDALPISGVEVGRCRKADGAAGIGFGDARDAGGEEHQPAVSGRVADDVGVAHGAVVPVARRVFLVVWSRDVDRKSTRLNSSHVKISYAVF